MSKGSRSPKSDRHYRHSKSDRRERESGSSHRKSSRERDRDSRKQRDRDDYYRESTSSSRKVNAQRGIDAAKNCLRASLTTAITDLKTQDRDQTISNADYNERSFSLSVLDSVNRQKDIERIQEDGFVPARFVSSNTTEELLRSKSKKGNHSVQNEPDVKMHDKAMFGALWTSREIEQKMLKDKNVVKKEEPNEDDEELEIKKPPEPDISIAHERLSGDPVARRQKWLELFRERRKALLSGN